MNNFGKLIMKIQLKHNIKKNFQRNKLLIILFLISIILCETLIFNGGFFKYRFNDLREQNYHVNDATLNGFELINGRLIPINNDPNITLNNINLPVEYLSINCTNSNPDSIGQVFFREEGEFFSESNSIKFSWSSPEKILKLPKLLKVASLRLDLTDTKNDSIYCKELSLNPKVKYDFSYGRLIIYLLIFVGLFFGYKIINPSLEENIKSTLIDHLFWILALLIIIVDLIYPVTLTFDSGHYLMLSEVIRQGNWEAWDPLRNVIFPFTLFTSLSFLGFSQNA